jgi:hypothetical protein
MCEKCNETGNTEKVEYTPEQLQELVSNQTVDSETALYYTDPLILNTENLAEDIKFDTDEFNKGIKDVSCICGMYTGLINSGMSNIDAMTYILTLENVKFNIELAKINANATIEASKNQVALLDKNQV